MKSFILIMLFASFNLHAFEVEKFKGIDSETGEECSVTLENRLWGEVSYLGDVTFMLRRFRGGSLGSGCDQKYSYCLFGPPIDDEGNIVDEIEYDLFIAFDDNSEPLYYHLENSGYNSTLDRECRLSKQIQRQWGGPTQLTGF